MYPSGPFVPELNRVFDKAALAGAALCFGGPQGIIFHSSCATPKGMKGLGVKHLSMPRNQMKVRKP